MARAAPSIRVIESSARAAPSTSPVVMKRARAAATSCSARTASNSRATDCSAPAAPMAARRHAACSAAVEASRSTSAEAITAARVRTSQAASIATGARRGRAGSAGLRGRVGEGSGGSPGTACRRLCDGIETSPDVNLDRTGISSAGAARRQKTKTAPFFNPCAHTPTARQTNDLRARNQKKADETRPSLTRRAPYARAPWKHTGKVIGAAGPPFFGFAGPWGIQGARRMYVRWPRGLEGASASAPAAAAAG